MAVNQFGHLTDEVLAISIKRTRGLIDQLRAAGRDASTVEQVLSKLEKEQASRTPSPRAAQ